MDSIISQVQALAENANESTRRDILDGLRNLASSLESSQDTVQRIAYVHFQPVLIRVGLDLKIFNRLSEVDTPLSVSELSGETGAAPTLLVGVIRETEKDMFTANNITKYLSDPGVQSAVYHNVNTIGPAIFALPDFLAENKYRDIKSPVNTPLQKAFNIDVPAFVWAVTQPERLGHMHRYMEAEQKGMRPWVDAYPITERCRDLEPQQVLFVDVGGGLGHQAVALKKQLPEIHNSAIVQDLHVDPNDFIKHPGVETMKFDFFQPQVVQGARIYYFRMIMHDYPDEQAAAILKNTIPVLGPDSVILIDDMVLPDSGVHWHSTQFDITMMTTLASQERTEEQWHTLMEKAGLKIRKIYTYSPRCNSVIECVPI
ncbi:hypothetical protein N7510_005850 [Penicillium lagena]|uniref:uncharacterized protein n=1 Tax=Penicillium lagena TaxID=94218 RepID=UPI00253FC12B|nr:uncharacterized protein N7510_005850 [Penicillium lagena]KAJ5612656.1 hypothetical protein N7510_005850 [Penicillium lagena]